MRIVALALIAGAVVSAQGRAGGQQVPIDEARARQLYVSNRHEDHPVANYQAAIDAKAAEDARYVDACRGIMECTKITYRSSVGDMDIPAYLFQPLDKGAPRSRAAMIWVHGGVHGNWAISYFPFVREAVQKGYVIIAPEYRGSTGYGEAHTARSTTAGMRSTTQSAPSIT
jgi:dipeptidyl aminopeptidase/acylaminoacyl peptidase